MRYCCCIPRLSQGGEDAAKRGGGGVGGHTLKSHGNYIVDHGESWKNHGIALFEFLWES